MVQTMWFISFTRSSKYLHAIVCGSTKITDVYLYIYLMWQTFAFIEYRNNLNIYNEGTLVFSSSLRKANLFPKTTVVIYFLPLE